MKIILTEVFRKNVAGLGEAERASVFEVLLALPKALGDPHRHGGAGLRKLHVSGIWEARVGLGLRIVFGYQSGELTLVRCGNHDEVRRFLKDL